MNTNKFRMTVLAAAMAVCAVANASPTAHGNVDLDQLHPVHLTDYQSTAGQTMDQFLLSIRANLRSYSDAHQVEVCGQIAESADHRFSVMVFTDNSHLGCVSMSANVMPGYTATVYTVHTHGGKRSFRMNRADKVLSGMDPFDAAMHPMQRDDLEHFSKLDYQAAGFLATPTTVRFQNGSRNSECDVKDTGCGL